MLLVPFAPLIRHRQTSNCCPPLYTIINRQQPSITNFYYQTSVRTCANNHFSSPSSTSFTTSLSLVIVICHVYPSLNIIDCHWLIWTITTIFRFHSSSPSYHYFIGWTLTVKSYWPYTDYCWRFSTSLSYSLERSSQLFDIDCWQYRLILEPFSSIN